MIISALRAFFHSQDGCHMEIGQEPHCCIYDVVYMQGREGLDIVRICSNHVPQGTIVQEAHDTVLRDETFLNFASHRVGYVSYVFTTGPKFAQREKLADGANIKSVNIKVLVRGHYNA
eukprot:2984428-Pleurochrysis_carterae.AAC.1